MKHVKDWYTVNQSTAAETQLQDLQPIKSLTQHLEHAKRHLRLFLHLQRHYRALDQYKLALANIGHGL